MRGHFLAVSVLLALSVPVGMVRAETDVALEADDSAKSASDSAPADQPNVDEERERELRKRQEEYSKLDRRYTKQLKRCRNGDRIACSVASETWAEMQLLLLADGAAVSSR